jgi:hypothetical protein
MNERNSQDPHLPTREETEAKMRGEFNGDKLPSRQIAERNSAYNLAKEAGERFGDELERAKNHAAPNADITDQSGRQNQNQNQNQMQGGMQMSGNSGQMSGNKGQMSGSSGQIRPAGQQPFNPHQVNPNLDPNFEKENALPETVSLDTDPYQGPSKLG